MARKKKTNETSIQCNDGSDIDDRLNQTDALVNRLIDAKCNTTDILTRDDLARTCSEIISDPSISPSLRLDAINKLSNLMSYHREPPKSAPVLVFDLATDGTRHRIGRNIKTDIERLASE